MRQTLTQKIKSLAFGLFFAAAGLVLISGYNEWRLEHNLNGIHKVFLDPSEIHVSAIFSIQTGQLLVESYKPSTQECILRSYDHDEQAAHEVAKEKTFTLANCRLMKVKGE